MLPILLLTCGLIWILVLSQQINRKGFLVLIIWLFIAPLISTIIKQAVSEPAPEEPVMAEMQPSAPAKKVVLTESTTRLRDFTEPTRLLFGLFFVLFLLNMLLKKNPLSYLGKYNRTEMYMGLFSIFLIVNATLMSKRPLYGLRTVCDAFIIPFIGYFLARRLVTNEGQLQKFVKIIGYMSTYVITIALIERMSHQELIYRISGPFPTPNTLYAVLAVSFFIILAELNNKEIRLKSNFISFSVFRKCVLYLTPLVILLTLGRGNWVGFLLGLGAFIFMARKLTKFSTKVLAFGLLLLFASVMIIALPSLLPDDLVNKRVGNIQNINARLGAWFLIINEGFNHTVLGMGIHNLRYLLAETNFSSWSGHIVVTAHNSFLAITAELGITGLLMYSIVILSMLWAGMYQYRRGIDLQAKWRGIAVVSILIAYLTPAMFANTVYIDVPLHHVYAYAYAGAIVGVYKQRRLIARPRPSWSLGEKPGAAPRRALAEIT